MKKAISAIMAVIMMMTLCACGGGGKSANFQEVMSDSSWITWHWFFNEKDGDSGFFTDDSYYTWEFDGANGFTVSTPDNSFGGTGTLEWTSENQADVFFKMGDQEQFWTAEFSYDSTHTDQVHFMIQETNFVYVLEPVK